MKKYHFTIILLFLFLVSTTAQNYKYLRWVKVRNGNIPSQAVVGGEEHGETFYVARANYMGGVHPGKTKNGWTSCNIGYGGKEIEVNDYEVLVYSESSTTLNDLLNEVLRSSSSIASEAHDILESYPDDRFAGLFLNEEEVNSLNRKLKKLQDNAIKARCYKVSDQIDEINKMLESNLPSRANIKKEIESLYETAKEC